MAERANCPAHRCVRARISPMRSGSMLSDHPPRLQPMTISALIFDVDGTLVDTNQMHIEAWVRSFERHGYRVAADRIFPEVGKGGDKVVPDLLGSEADERDGDSLRDGQSEEFLRAAKERRIKVFDGVAALMESLKERGIRTALATSSRMEQLEGILESARCDLRELVDEVVTADDAEESKPAPDLVRAAVRALGVSPAECAMVGDTRWDVLACRDAGVVALGVLAGGNEVSTLRDAGARGVWKDVAELHADLDAALQCASPGAAVLTDELLQSLMAEALQVARDALERDEVPIGAIVARGDGTVVARGYNEGRSTGDVIAHAEIVALHRAAGVLEPDTRDAILVSTVEPCVMCTGAAMTAAIDTVIYALPAPLDGGTARVKPPRSPDTQMPRIVGNIRAAESRKLLSEWLEEHADQPQARYVRQLLEEV